MRERLARQLVGEGDVRGGGGAAEGGEVADGQRHVAGGESLLIAREDEGNRGAADADGLVDGSVGRVDARGGVAAEVDFSPGAHADGGRGDEGVAAVRVRLRVAEEDEAKLTAGEVEGAAVGRAVDLSCRDKNLGGVRRRIDGFGEVELAAEGRRDARNRQCHAAGEAGDIALAGAEHDGDVFLAAIRVDELHRFRNRDAGGVDAHARRAGQREDAAEAHDTRAGRDFEGVAGRAGHGVLEDDQAQHGILDAETDALVGSAEEDVDAAGSDEELRHVRVHRIDLLGEGETAAQRDGVSNGQRGDRALNGLYARGHGDGWRGEGHGGRSLVHHDGERSGEHEVGHADELHRAAARHEGIRGRRLGHQGGVHRLEHPEGKTRTGDTEPGFVGGAFIRAEEDIHHRGRDVDLGLCHCGAHHRLRLLEGEVRSQRGEARQTEDDAPGQGFDVGHTGGEEVERHGASRRCQDARRAHVVCDVGAGVVNLYRQETGEGHVGHPDEFHAAGGGERVGGRRICHRVLEQDEAKARVVDADAGLVWLAHVCTEEDIHTRRRNLDFSDVPRGGFLEAEAAAQRDEAADGERNIGSGEGFHVALARAELNRHHRAEDSDRFVHCAAGGVHAHANHAGRESDVSEADEFRGSRGIQRVSRRRRHRIHGVNRLLVDDQAEARSGNPHTRFAGHLLVDAQEGIYAARADEQLGRLRAQILRAGEAEVAFE